jgi:hypothetical protein
MSRLVVAIAGLLVIASCLYPPYEVEAFYPADGEVAEETVYAPLWSPPSGGEGEYRKVEDAGLATGRLGVQVAVTVTAGAVVGAAVPKATSTSD